MDERVKQALSKGGVIDITTTGRQSGRPRRIEIIFHNFDGHLYISGFPREKKRSWLANLEANPQFTFHLKSSAAVNLRPGFSLAGDISADLPATARPITDKDERRQVLTKVAQVWPQYDLDLLVKQAPLVEVALDVA
jgi:nitroimidazol reductase NimA-like FMN-containing flavoprotein (pyridoxamine 5'-phosphate oxidase superfamily)